MLHVQVSSSLLRFAAFRLRSKIRISPLPPLLSPPTSPLRCQTAVLTAPLRTFPTSPLLSLPPFLSCVIQSEGDFQNVTISCFAASLQPWWTRWRRDCGLMFSGGDVGCCAHWHWSRKELIALLCRRGKTKGGKTKSVTPPGRNGECVRW